MQVRLTCRLGFSAMTASKDQMRHSLRSCPHYRALSTTMVLHFGTMTLVVVAACDSPLTAERQVLTFPSGAYCQVTPCFTPDAGTAQTNNRINMNPAFDIRFGLRRHLRMVHFRSSPNSSSDVVLSRLLHDRSPQRLLANAASWRFVPCPCWPMTEGRAIPPSPVEHNTFSFYIEHLPRLRDAHICTPRVFPSIYRARGPVARRVSSCLEAEGRISGGF